MMTLMMTMTEILMSDNLPMPKEVGVAQTLHRVQYQWANPIGYLL